MIKSLVRQFFFAAAAVVLAVGAQAQVLQQRQLPATGQRGELGDNLPLPMVAVSGKVLRLAPGAVIFDRTNRTILQSALPPHGAVLYTTDANGDIVRLYLLTRVEREMLDRAGRQ